VLRACGEELPQAFERLAFSVGIEAWMQAVFACNAYIDEQAPWALRKTDPARMERVLATLCACIADLAIAIAPVVPGASAKILDTLAVAPERRDYAALGLLDGQEVRVVDPKPVFPRLELVDADLG
jgi:methionyl-tRNA synthetase